LHICRCDWSRAWTWIGQLEAANAPLGRALEKVHETLAMLPIDGWIDGVTTPGALTSEGVHKFLPAMTSTASTWLGEGWLSDSNIDVIIGLINKSAVALGLPGRALELQLVIQVLQKHLDHSAPGSNESPPHSFLHPSWSSIEADIPAELVTELFFPVFIHDNHFVLFKVNLVRKSIMFGDSLAPGSQPPEHHLRSLIHWLGILLPGKPWAISKPDFSVPHQDDYHSCGSVVVSTISASMLGTPPWSNEYQALHRIVWFLWTTNPD